MKTEGGNSAAVCEAPRRKRRFTASLVEEVFNLPDIIVKKNVYSIFVYKIVIFFFFLTRWRKSIKSFFD